MTTVRPVPPPAVLATALQDAGADAGRQAPILDAALALFLEFGTRRTTMDDVAKRAGVGRATLYRAFADRNALVQAVVVRECARAIRAIERQLAEIDDDEQRFVEGFVLVVRDARAHPLVRRLFDIEAEWLLPHFTVHGMPVLEIARTYVADRLRALQAQGRFPALDADAAAELLLRLAHSLVLTPGSLVSAQDEDSLRRYARHFVLPLLRRP
ncbi:MAG: TetR/AcrR family transcriptional regulator [Pseudomonadota bacterium]